MSEREQKTRRARVAALACALSAALLLVRCPSSTPPPASTSSPAAPSADLVLVGGTIAGDPSGATAIAIKAGKVIAVGKDDAIRALAGTGTKVIELGGHAVVPGLADSHMHLSGLGQRRFAVDLVGTSSIDEIRARLKKAAKDTKKGDWIRGRGWDQNDWEAFKKKGAKFPTAKDLDDITPDNPVILTRIDGHAIWVNSKAMKIAGVDAKTKAKAGGEIVKAANKPSGIFIDNAIPLISDKVPPPSHDEIKEGMRLAQKDCLGAGLVQVQDMGVGSDVLAVLKELDQSGELDLRVYAMLDGDAHDLAKMMENGPLMPAGPDRRLTVRGVKFFADGALGSRGAALFKPYNDDKKNSGSLVTAPDVLEARVRTASERGFQVATHAIGDKANRIVLDVYEKVLGAKAKEARPRIEHAQVVSVEDIPRFAKQSVIASMQPTHATSDMPWAEARIGKARLKGAYAWHSMLTSGATIAAGSDAPVEDISPLLGLYAAVTRKDELGAPEGGWMPEERMTPAEALAAFTTGAAFASFREGEAGRIAKDYVADLTVLDKDPLTTSADDIGAVQVQMTIVGGEVVFDRSAPPPVPKTSTSTAATSTSS